MPSLKSETAKLSREGARTGEQDAKSSTYAAKNWDILTVCREQSNRKGMQKAEEQAAYHMKGRGKGVAALFFVWAEVESLTEPPSILEHCYAAWR